VDVDLALWPPLQHENHNPTHGYEATTRSPSDRLRLADGAIGKSRGGLSTKIHIAVDALGNVLRLLYTVGRVHESTKAEVLIADLQAQKSLATKPSTPTAFVRMWLSAT
jgi:hypothetical protein